MCCSVTSFGIWKDLKPDVTWKAAHAAIAKAVAQFLLLMYEPTDAARAYVAEASNYTGRLLAGWEETHELEKQWCARAQQLNAANVSHKLHVNSTECLEPGCFELRSPSIEVATEQVDLVSEVRHSARVEARGLGSLSASEIRCKLIAEAAIAKAFHKNVTSTPGGCRAANEAALQYAYSLVSEETLRRYQREGKPFTIEEDHEYANTLTWDTASFEFTSNATHLQVTCNAIRGRS